MARVVHIFIFQKPTTYYQKNVTKEMQECLFIALDWPQLFLSNGERPANNIKQQNS